MKDMFNKLQKQDILSSCQNLIGFNSKNKESGVQSDSKKLDHNPNGRSNQTPKNIPRIETETNVNNYNNSIEEFPRANNPPSEVQNELVSSNHGYIEDFKEEQYDNTHDNKNQINYDVDSKMNQVSNNVIEQAKQNSQDNLRQPNTSLSKQETTDKLTRKSSFQVKTMERANILNNMVIARIIAKEAKVQHDKIKVAKFNEIINEGLERAKVYRESGRPEFLRNQQLQGKKY